MKWIFLICTFVMLYILSQKRFEYYDEIPKGSEETAEIAPILNQPFFYLGEGSQIVAFVSSDGSTVLKLFKARHEKPYTFSRYIRNLGKKDWEQSHQKWKIKFGETSRRYKTAFTHLKEETGLVFLHFQKTPISLPVTLKHRTSTTLDLAQYPFILQKRAILAPEYIKAHPEGIQALKEFFRARTEKGFSDPRQSLSVNYGFIEGRPIQIDPGKIDTFEGDISLEIEKIHAHIDEWATHL